MYIQIIYVKHLEPYLDLSKCLIILRITIIIRSSFLGTSDLWGGIFSNSHSGPGPKIVHAHCADGKSEGEPVGDLPAASPSQKVKAGI